MDNKITNAQLGSVGDRAKDLLNILFPLFGAVVTFWLGVAVEGRRADQNQATAEKESQERANAEARERAIKANAAAKLGEAKGRVMALREATAEKGMPGKELDAFVRVLEEGERAVVG